MRSSRLTGRDIGAVLAIALFYLGMESLGITCPIRFTTGISCAGCGMSRAWFSLLRGDWAAAFYYHPLFWLPIPCLLVFFLRRRLPKKLITGLAAGAIALFLLVWILRMADGTDEIVVCRPQEGAILRMVSWLGQNIRIFLLRWAGS